MQRILRCHKILQTYVSEYEVHVYVCAFQDRFKMDPPPPSVLRALWTRRRWFEVFGHRGQGLGHVEKKDQTLQWCWEQRGAGSSLGPNPAHYEGLDGRQNIKVEFKHDNP